MTSYDAQNGYQWMDISFSPFLTSFVIRCQALHLAMAKKRILGWREDKYRCPSDERGHRFLFGIRSKCELHISRKFLIFPMIIRFQIFEHLCKIGIKTQEVLLTTQAPFLYMIVFKNSVSGESNFFNFANVNLHSSVN